MFVQLGVSNHESQYEEEETDKVDRFPSRRKGRRVRVAL